MEQELKVLEEQKVDKGLIEAVAEFRAEHKVDESVKNRIIKPDMAFFGKEVLEMGIATLLKGENLLLTGPKATGKNILAENLAWIFARPVYNISFHVNTDSGDLIGTDTFENNEVKLRKGSIYRCAEYGGFGILDEINMAKNDAVSVLHATLDHRRSIDVPGYDKIEMDDATRFIGTMNYGYAGTKELNEALVSRFLVIDMPGQNEETLEYVFKTKFPTIKEEALDLRGMIGALRTISCGLKPSLAVKMGVVNKCFDIFEKEIVQDVVMTRIPESWNPGDVFE